MPHLDDVKTVQLCEQTVNKLGPGYAFLTIVVDTTDGMVSMASSFSDKEQMRGVLEFALRNLEDTESAFFPSDNSRLN